MGFSHHNSCQDHEDKRQGEVQGSVLQVPLHSGCHRQGEGRQAEAVITPRCVITWHWKGT